ncbi:MAG: hypothetical protein GY795_03820 [Desulfobacterales bacterium]|nr:hypothetical protein [Desulfobacterales bacterium]
MVLEEYQKEPEIWEIPLKKLLVDADTQGLIRWLILMLIYHQKKINTGMIFYVQCDISETYVKGEKSV